jgi:cytochrome P450
MDLNPFSFEFHEDPYSSYRWLREHAPLHYHPTLDFYTLARFRDVVAASQDWRTYSSAEGTLVERLNPQLFEATPMMIFMDPPRHDRLRKLVSSGFTARRVGALEPFIRATAGACSMRSPTRAAATSSRSSRRRPAQRRGGNRRRRQHALERRRLKSSRVASHTTASTNPVASGCT